MQLLVPNDICENRFIHILIFPSTFYNITSPDNCLSISRRIMQLYAAHMREVNKLTHEVPQDIASGSLVKYCALQMIHNMLSHKTL